MTCENVVGNILPAAFALCAMLASAWMFWDLRRHTGAALQARTRAEVWKTLADLAVELSSKGTLLERAQAGLVLNRLCHEAEHGADVKQLVTAFLEQCLAPRMALVELPEDKPSGKPSAEPPPKGPPPRRGEGWSGS